MIANTDSKSKRAWRLAHALWATLAAAVSLFLVFGTRGGHPPMVFLLPFVLAIWIVGHLVIWGARWLAARGQRIASGTGRDGSPWPVGLRFTLTGTGVAALIGIFQIVMTLLQGKLYPYRYADLWAMMLAIWLAHGACFAGLLLRQQWSRFVGAMLAFGWAILLALQIAEHLPPKPPSDAAELWIAFGMTVLLLLLGLYLVSSRKVKAFLTP